MAKVVPIVLAAAFTIVLTFGAAVYAADYGKSEMVHFRAVVPAGTVSSPTTIKGGGAMAPIVIDLQSRGIPKQLLNPAIEGISTHSIVNIGEKPVRIRMNLVNTTVPIRWEVSANLPYDSETRTFTEPLPPGRSIPNLGLDWFFEIPADRLSDPVVYDGGLELSDADTGEVLTFLPITVINSGAGAPVGTPASGEACH